MESILDLNGDGIMVVIAQETYEKSFGYVIFSLVFGLAFSAFCGE